MIKWLFIIGGFVAVLIVSISLFLQPNSFIGCGETPSFPENCRAADVIVVVSGGDTEARTRAGIQLYKNGWADLLLLSGAAQDQESQSNAAAMKQQALTAGVPESAIIVEEEARNTQQNAEHSQSIIKQRGLSDVILVTSGYHQRRTSLEFRREAEGVTVRDYPVLQDKQWGYFWWLTPRGWWLAGGELVKIGVFSLSASIAPSPGDLR